ncbi:MAG TPA: metallophosphoesterase family protein [Syntrophomonas sp.]|nr:metallophosphoesterase family protein [Syntrophomonas sp.]
MFFFSRFLAFIKTHPRIKTTGVFCTGLLAALLAVWLLGYSTVKIEGVTMKAALAPSASGITELNFPPFGVITAPTHQGPVKLSLTLEQIDSRLLNGQLNHAADSKALLLRLQKGIKASVYDFALRQLLIALVVAWVMILLVWRTNWKTALLHAVLGTALLAMPVVYAISTYDTNAFREPEYKGVLSMAPSAIEFVSNSLSDLHIMKENTDKIVTNFRKLFLHADALMVMADAEEQQKMVKVLLVSDLHSNPVGVEFIKSTAHRFQVDFIINAGDLTDLGTATEFEAIRELQSIPVPQLLAPGNHDSPEIIDIIAQLDNVTVLDGQMLTVAGIKVIGFADPLADDAAVEYENPEKTRQILAEEAVRIQAGLEDQERPDILVVHHPSLGEKLMSLAEITVSGHNHQLQIKQQNGSTFINPGTAGAAGLRGLYSEEGRAYSAVIAYLIPGSGLMAMDLINYEPASKQFSLHRKVIQPADTLEATP